MIPYYPGGLKPGAAYDQFVHDSLNGHGAPPVNDTMLAAVKAMYPCGSDADDCSQVAADLIAEKAKAAAFAAAMVRPPARALKISNDFALNRL